MYFSSNEIMSKFWKTNSLWKKKIRMMKLPMWLGEVIFSRNHFSLFSWFNECIQLFENHVRGYVILISTGKNERFLFIRVYRKRNENLVPKN